jgi:pimeloyl-ACP methyl ester carboxylesterase
MLGRLAAADTGIRVHLMGHSFGARLVAYSLSGLPQAATGANSPIKTLYLIQGAFSHFALANPVPDSLVSGPGALSDFGRNVNGPLLCTFSAADRAVGWWYPAASMLAHQDAESADNLTYQWGGMGHDGYQQSPAGTVVKLASEGTPYNFRRGGYYLLDSNAVICEDQSPISGAHSDIRHPEVVWPVVDAAS